ncbi:hypothetical protein SLEP1_g36614 [Rubroshorea leprosula]|uniref:Uncharacterized protein n=1 Tax=Rubroshorea leprosula TaxID=152421 RepID=A0AAV5KSJ6_9ROSI|nr:hypothetical protein SLEP1_g36614 [Rubroshorea leprosula]
MAGFSMFLENCGIDLAELWTLSVALLLALELNINNTGHHPHGIIIKKITGTTKTRRWSAAASQLIGWLKIVLKSSTCV